jgi:hypothetical protein
MTGHGWSRVGDDICYYRNFFRRPQRHAVAGAAAPPVEDQYFYSLTFSVSFPHDGDTCFLSYCYPFTYTFQRQCLQWLGRQPLVSLCMRRQPLCYTRGGHLCELLTITEFGASPEVMRARPVVFLTARVHPGESNASWTMKGILEFLTSTASEAAALRRQLVFKIVPVLNPDGVINGNYRCALAGCDLNRRWQQPDLVQHPTLFHVKRLLRAIAAERQVLLYCDFHGHSNLKDVVLYGCDDASAREKKEKGDEVEADSDGEPSDDEAVLRPAGAAPPGVPPISIGAAADASAAAAEATAASAAPPGPFQSSAVDEMERCGAPLPLAGDWAWLNTRGRSRLFPALLARRAPHYFNFDRCTFTVSKSKAGASRVVMWKDLKLAHSFTLEASFCGASTGPLGGMHFVPNDFEEVGKNFCLGILDLIAPDQNAVYAAIGDVQRSLAGKRSLPPTHHPNVVLPSYAAVVAAAAASAASAAANFVTAGSGGGAGGAAAQAAAAASAASSEKKDKKKKKKSSSGAVSSSSGKKKSSKK